MIYQNTTLNTITLQIEPWCQKYKIEPQETVVVTFENELFLSDIELIQDEGSFIIFGNFNNEVSVFSNGVKLKPFF